MNPPLAPEGAQPFVLQPFGCDPAELGLELVGWVERQGVGLSITYQLRGHLASVVIPASSTAPPHRQDGLWEHTCFELFLTAEGTRPYWEMNLAPNGHWNLYRLNDIRQGLAPVMDRDTLPCTVGVTDQRLELTVVLPLPQELADAWRHRALRLGVTAVVEQSGGELSYWALAHGGPAADFHRREDFLLRLEPSLHHRHA